MAHIFFSSSSVYVVPAQWLPKEYTMKPSVNYFTSVKKYNQWKLDVLVAYLHEVGTGEAWHGEEPVPLTPLARPSLSKRGKPLNYEHWHGNPWSSIKKLAFLAPALCQTFKLWTMIISSHSQYLQFSDVEKKEKERENHLHNITQTGVNNH